MTEFLSFLAGIGVGVVGTIWTVRRLINIAGVRLPW